MESLFVLRGRLQEVYARNSKIIDKAIQFVLALVTFYLINHNIGFMKMAASPAATVALAVICTFLPMVMIVIAATALILAHTFSVSLATLAVTAIVFLVMYIFYFRLTPKMTLIVLLTPIAFAFKIPYVIPVAFGLVSAPVSLVAVACGTVVFYMLKYVKSTAAVIEGSGAKGLMTQISAYAKQVFQSKEMWIVIVAFIICFFVVYTLRRQSMDHAWKIAVVAGAVADVVVIAAGDIALGVHTSYGTLIVGSIAAVIIGLVLEFFFFSVDYARSENLQYEDDEYYYFVKAIPKISVATPEKTVKRINERQETEIIDTEEVRRKARRGGAVSKKAPSGKETSRKAMAADGKKPAPKRGPSAKGRVIGNTEQILLTQSMKKDLNLDKE
ncbi:hypothetical protein [Extibacter muris]|uniref:hypothetical protein n=1 Tax=Extibacter muris TaxID=1796622 RepID=UPI001D05DB31|nr:hypothetical protein [Extibacter muris]MCB6201624.1 hypothetical protein [Extibacter muris]MCQ4662950.1 hypothetical protein [Extibacter muris]MCQ4694248.1 hypothetical protein [Extibacter muris]